MRLLLFSVFLFPLTVTCVRDNRVQAEEKQILDKILSRDNYDKRIRPTGLTSEEINDAVVVSTNAKVRSISSIDDVKMEFSMQMTFRAYWIDPRLRFNATEVQYLTLTNQEKIWKPDIFFNNEKRSSFHNMIMPNVLLRIQPNGQVIYSIRLSITFSCPMDLSYFPLDIQTCPMQMSSYGYTSDDMVILWLEDNPIEIPHDLLLPRFSLDRQYLGTCTHRTTTGEYSCVEANLVFIRDFSYYVLRIYIPCTILVIVSWFNFWLDPNSAPARIGLGITTLLTTTATIAGINSSLPPVSYVKAIDVWSVVCLLFAFSALFEYALVNYSLRRDKKRKTQRDAEGKGQGRNVCGHNSWWRRNTISKRIDIISRFAFPVLFLIFNAFYWSICVYAHVLAKAANV